MTTHTLVVDVVTSPGWLVLEAAKFFLSIGAMGIWFNLLSELSGYLVLGLICGITAFAMFVGTDD
jgi:hypothetical protein